jgi:hypothetical protein
MKVSGGQVQWMGVKVPLGFQSVLPLGKRGRIHIPQTIEM